jgi:hypothetical protein
MLTCPHCGSDDNTNYLTSAKLNLNDYPRVESEDGKVYLKICLKCYQVFLVMPKRRPTPIHSTIDEDIREDSEADGAILFDDWMFPPEF